MLHLLQHILFTALQPADIQDSALYSEKERNYYNETIVTIAGLYLFTRLTNVFITEINNYDLGVSGRA